MTDSRLTSQGKILDIDGGLVAGVPPQTATTLLDVDLSVLDKCRLFEAGSWVMSVETEVLEWPGPAVGPQRTCPLVARVSFGAGGASHQIELDALPGFVIQLPSITARCDLAWSLLPSQENVPAFNQWVIPNRVRVRGIVYRGVARPYGHRSFLARRNPGAGVLAIHTIGNIPKFSRSCMVYGGLDNTAPPILPYDAATVFQLLSDATLGNVVTDFTGPQLQTLKSWGSRIPITSQATQWALETPAGPATPLFPVIVDFEISM